MNQLNEWSQLISKRLKSEAELVGVQAKHELYQDSAKETFIRVVLEQFLPDNFGIGSGRVIDAKGNKSDEQDIVIYRRDYPQLNLPGGTDIFLYESVLATIQVKTKLVRKTFFEALDQCASMADLQPVFERTTLSSIAAKNKLVLNKDNEYQHSDPLMTARFNLIGRPLTFVYAFNGYQTSPRQLEENIDMWIDYRRENELSVDMKSCATVIATQGCFAARNASPFSSKQNVLFGIGSDESPVRLIILQLMHALNRRLRKSNDTLGVRQGLDAYLNTMPLPKITSSTGKTLYGEKTATVKAKEDKPTESLLRAKVSFSTPPPKPATPDPVTPAPLSEQPISTRINASKGLGSRIQSTSAFAQATSSERKYAKASEPTIETERVSAMEQDTSSLMETHTMVESDQDSEPNPFLQTIPQLRN